MKKIISVKFIYTILILGVVSLSGIATLFYLYASQVDALTDHYPIFDAKKKEYTLVRARPKFWVGLKNISKYAQGAIVISEDWAFYEHKGVDFEQLKIAINDSLKAGEFVRGASTITQQVVKNCFLSNEKSLIRKIKEFILARELEKKFSKEKILEIYLNLIELGPGVYGIKNGSYHYFQKSPSYLNAKEGAFLAMLLPNPKRYAESYNKKELTDFASTQVDNILVKMRQARIITEDQREDLLNYKLPFEKILAKELIQVERTLPDMGIMESKVKPQIKFKPLIE